MTSGSFFKECERTIPAGARGSACKYSRACPGFRTALQKTTGAGGETGTTRFGRGVRLIIKTLEFEVTSDVFQQSQTTGGRIFFRRHLQVQYRNIGLVKSGPPNRGLQIVCGHHVILITQRPVNMWVICDSSSTIKILGFIQERSCLPDLR